MLPSISRSFPVFPSPAGFAAVALALFFPREADAQIYADFDTSMGGFTLELFHEDAPMAVANFVGLAEGSLPWIDLDISRIVHDTPYYDGIKFHRVIKDFMIQGGSPNGRGTDGPGYKFKDQLARDKSGALLHPHDQQGLISMANSGINTNGSQFFITDVPTPWLDGKHEVFGKIAGGPFGTLAEGITVITAMNNVPTTGSVPNEDLVINAITIRRIGPEAMAFDLHSQGLPVLSELQGELVVDRSGSGVAELNYPKTAYSQIDVYSSIDLRNWSAFNSSIYFDDTPEADDISGLLGSESRRFFRINKIDYSPQPHPGGPESLASATLKLVFASSPIDDMDLVIDTTGIDGTWALADGSDSGPLDALTYTPRSSLFADEVFVSFAELLPFLFSMRIDLSFDTPLSGRFAGPTNATYQGSPLNVSGTFELVP